MKCKRCEKDKLREDFYARLDKESRCKHCVREMRRTKYHADPLKYSLAARKIRSENPERIKDYKLKQTYGISLEYYNSKLKEQNNVCGACGRPETKSWRGKLLKLAVDHDHGTGEIRGLLCLKCNRALGLLEDNISTINNLASYVSKYKKLG